jgi:hypothetical protein
MLALLNGEGNPIVLLAEGDGLPGTVGDAHFHGQAFVTQILLLIQEEINRDLRARKNGCEAKDDGACKSSHSDSLKGRITDASRNGPRVARRSEMDARARRIIQAKSELASEANQSCITR